MQIAVNKDKIATTNCLACCRPKKSKKSNRGLATFDKKNYFPISFIEHHAHERESVMSNPKGGQIIKKVIKSTANIV